MIDTLRNIFFRDFWLKLFSTVLAILIWLTVSFAIHRDVSPPSPLEKLSTGELTFTNIPVLIMSLAADVHDVKVLRSEVTVKVRGETKYLKILQASDIHALVDLTGGRESEAGQRMRKKIVVTTPANISYLSVEPEEVEVLVPPKK